jgi:hypothetical protein
MSRRLARFQRCGRCGVDGPVWTVVDVLQVLDDKVRSMLCPDKITTNEWLEVCLLAAHIVGRGTCA